MTQYVKITKSGALEYAPRNKGSISNWISDTVAVLEEGYKPLATVEVPEGYYVKGYKEEDDSIVPVLEKYEEPVLTYVEQRRAAYPAIEEQLDMLYWDKVKGTNIWQETIAEIKNTYPKPEENNFYNMTLEF